MIRFTHSDHAYRSVDPEDQVDWIGVSTLISFFKPPFDAESAAVKSSKNKRSKWYGLDPLVIRQAWKDESQRSLDVGTWYHELTESLILSEPTFKLEDVELSVIAPTIVGEEKYASIQTLEDNHMYPEHLVYLRTDGICGQTDRVEVVNKKVNIRDYKTSKQIKMEGFTGWDGMTARMREPLTHLDDCNFVHYGLQMSLYMYMILKHNPQLSAGTLTLDHIIFELDSEDQYGYPIYKKDAKGDFIVKEIKPYIIPYMKSEVMSILYYLKDNREVLKQSLKYKTY